MPLITYVKATHYIILPTISVLSAVLETFAVIHGSIHLRLSPNQFGHCHPRLSQKSPEPTSSGAPLSEHKRNIGSRYSGNLWSGAASFSGQGWWTWVQRDFVRAYRPVYYPLYSWLHPTNQGVFQDNNHGVFRMGCDLSDARLGDIGENCCGCQCQRETYHKHPWALMVGHGVRRGAVCSLNVSWTFAIIAIRIILSSTNFGGPICTYIGMLTLSVGRRCEAQTISR